MIVDDMREASPGFRRMVALSHVIRVPFEVCPFTTAPDNEWGLWWQDSKKKGPLVPKTADDKFECSWWRPPYDSMIVASESAEPGILLVKALPPPSEAHYDLARSSPNADEHIARLRQIADSKWRVMAALIVHHADMAICLRAIRLIEMDDRVAVVDTDEPADIALIQEGLFGQAVSAPAMAGIREFFASLSDEGKMRDAMNVACTVAVACALLCCRNITSERHTPPEKLQRARRRRGKLPLVSWHLLKVHGQVAPHGRGAAGAGDSLALHWVRGHFKHYTPERPLLGRAVGTYWWTPHLAGRADRVVLKDYQVGGDDGAR